MVDLKQSLVLAFLRDEFRGVVSKKRERDFGGIFGVPVFGRSSTRGSINRIENREMGGNPIPSCNKFKRCDIRFPRMSRALTSPCVPPTPMKLH